MKASVFSDAQKAFVLQGGDGVPVAEICGRAGISSATDFMDRNLVGWLHACLLNRLK